MAWLVAAVLGALVVGAVALVVAQRSEIAYLRAGLEQRREHERRVERVEVGLPEFELDPPENDIPPPSTAAEIEDLLDAWGSQATQDHLRKDIREFRRDGHEWDYIMDWLRDQVMGP